MSGKTFGPYDPHDPFHRSDWFGRGDGPDRGEGRDPRAGRGGRGGWGSQGARGLQGDREARRTHEGHGFHGSHGESGSGAARGTSWGTSGGSDPFDSLRPLGTGVPHDAGELSERGTPGGRGASSECGVPGERGVRRGAPGMNGASGEVRGLYVAREVQGAGDAADGRRQNPANESDGRRPGAGLGDDIAVGEGAGGAVRGAVTGGGSGRGGGAGSGGRGGGGFGGGDGCDGGDGGGFGGEDELRRLLQSRVGELEPSVDALDRLRRAVPARRQRRRHLVVGAAAALLLGGTSIPAMVHVVSLGDNPEDRPANAASSQRAHGGAEGAHGEGTEQAGPRPTGKDGRKPDVGAPAEKGAAKEQDGQGHEAGAGTPDPHATMDVSSPVCGRQQLGNGTGTVGAADSAGRVYGAFRVVNTSASACTVDGGGAVGLVAQGATKPDRVHVVDHTSGDDATRLPDPATAPGKLVLKPGEAYEIKFAWIPESGGSTTGCVNPGPSPTPLPSKAPGETTPAASSVAGDGGGQAGGSDGPGDGGAVPGAVLLSHTPEAGEPAAADAKIPDACAGTVYRTGALAAK